MTESIVSQIKDKLCPDGIWRLSDIMKSILKRQINRMPKGNASDEEAMYPSTAAGMREFLSTFFSRHYFQIQNSLMDYIDSEDFEDIISNGEIRILDIGCGPAVGVLAVTDIIRSLLENQSNSVLRPVRFVYVLNDTSKICLSIGQRMLNEYLDLCRVSKIGTGEQKVLTLTNDFPNNIKQLERIEKNYGTYHLMMFSYVIRPLVDENGTSGLAKDIVKAEKLCESRGRMLILQDQYRESLLRMLGKQINASVENKELTQEIFPKRGTADTHTYSYYQCLYKPRHNSAEAVTGRAKAVVFESI
ncbi:MAG: hypothetical protein JW749_07550 [Sedimentisphaerales bacterium]|nr:hypothetical protein [Sedimentisphaerales bacterium]